MAFWFCFFVFIHAEGRWFKSCYGLRIFSEYYWFVTEKERRQKLEFIPTNQLPKFMIIYKNLLGADDT